MILLYPFLALLSLLFSGFVWAAAYPLALTARKDGNLPRLLRWCQTFDATLDAGWQDNYFTTYAGYPGHPDTWEDLLRLRAMWLQRNPGYTFDLVLGVPYDTSRWRVIKWNPVKKLFFAVGPWGSFSFYWSLGPVEVKLGWKVWNLYDETTGTWAENARWAAYGKLPICATIKKSVGA